MKYLDFIHSLPCCVCRARPPSQAAHIRTGTGGGMGLKPHDKWTVPLCDTCHKIQHNIGEKSFWKDVDFVKSQALLLYSCKQNWERGVTICFKIARENMK